MDARDWYVLFLLSCIAMACFFGIVLAAMSSGHIQVCKVDSESGSMVKCERVG